MEFSLYICRSLSFPLSLPEKAGNSETRTSKAVQKCSLTLRCESAATQTRSEDPELQKQKETLYSTDCQTI